MWQAGILILYLIQHAHSANDPRCPVLNRSVRCNSYLKVDQCQTDTDCHRGKVCCPQKCGKECVTPIKQKQKPGICPAVNEKPLEFCKRARVGSNCYGNDADCKGSKKCCPDICGSQNCKEPISGPRPGCPAVRKPEPQCLLFSQACSHDKECQKGKICCGVICGTGCVYPVKPNPPKPRHGVCPSLPKEVPDICKRIRVISNCHVDADCKSRNQKCCRKPCGNFACTDPLKGDHPGCPVCLNNQGSTECPVCVRYQQLCNADTECKPGQMCCFNPSCGTSCKGKVCPEILCPLIKCSLGFQKDENGCEICKCRQDPCPMYSPPPPWLCTDGKAKIFYVDGVKCYGPPGIIPCNKDCRLPKQPGPCKGSFPRYFFNLKTMKCEKFIYGGCQGNANNFELLTECQDKCIDKPRPKCPPLCEIFCPFGNVIDKNNCPICKCKTGCTDIASPLPSVSCGLGKPRCPSKYQCKTAQNGVGVCCPYECPLYKCKSCPYGYVIDANGCQTCTCKPRCGPVCAIFCPFGNVLDENNCPTCRCKTGCKGNVSPLGSISCGSGQQRCPARYQCNTPSAGGSGVCCPYVCPQIKCSRPCPYGYKSDVNVCQTCQCLPACEKGTPQGTCRFGPLDSKPCPSGTYCKNSVCCKIPCKFGDPHPTLSCGMVIGSNKCPAGYSCLGGPADEYFACCPDENKPTPDKCPRDRYPNSRCYVRRSCRNDSSCLGKKKCCKQGCQYKCVNPV